jgi:hypothetical protein
MVDLEEVVQTKEFENVKQYDAETEINRSRTIQFNR